MVELIHRLRSNIGFKYEINPHLRLVSILTQKKGYHILLVCEILNLTIMILIEAIVIKIANNIIIKDYQLLISILNQFICSVMYFHYIFNFLNLKFW